MADNSELNLLAPGALEEVKQAYASVKDLGDLIVEVNGKLKAGELKIQGADKISALNTGIEELQANLSTLTAAQNQYVASAENAAKATSSTGKEAKLTATQQRELANEYLQLNKALKEAQIRAQNYAIVLGKNHAITIQARDDANALRGVISELNFGVGDYTKNVGNYNGVGTQFNQLLRELPNAGISLQTFILSLSNNITYFAEAVQIARASGQSWGAILGTLGQSMFGLVGIINIAVGVLVLFGDKLIKAFSSDADKATEGLTKLQKAVASLKQEVEDFKVPTFFDTQNLSNLDKGEAALKRQIDLMKARGDSEGDIVEKEKLLKRIQIQNIKDEIKLYETRETSIIRFDKEIYELKQKQADLENGILVDQSSYEKSLRDKSLKEYERYLKQREALAQAIAQAALKNRTKETIDELNAVAKEINNATNYGDVITDALIKTKGEAMQKELDRVEAQNTQRALGIENSYLAGLYKTYADYEKAKTDAVEQGAKDRFEIEKRYLQEFIDLLPIDSAERQKYIKQLAEFELKVKQQLSADKTKEDKKYSKENQKQSALDLDTAYKVAKEIQEFTAKIFDQVGSILQSQSAARLDALNAHTEQVEKDSEKEIERIKRSKATTEQKEEAIRYQEGLTANARKEAALEEIKIKQRMARFDKVAAIAKIITDTAVAVLYQLKSGDPYTAFARAAVAGAAGAVQLGIALAAPIPQYAKGTDKHKGGAFIAGDGGERELVQHPDGTAYWTGDNPAVYSAPAGTRVIPESKLASSVANLGMSNIMRRQQTGQVFDTRNLERAINRMNTTVNNHIEVHTDNLKIRVSRR